MDRRDLALEVAFTSMSLRERWRGPGVVGVLVLTSLPETEQRAEAKFIQLTLFYLPDEFWISVSSPK